MSDFQTNALHALNGAMDVMSPYLSVIDKAITPYLTRAVSWSDPTTVIITLFILLSPIALAYICLTRMAMVKFS